MYMFLVRYRVILNIRTNTNLSLSCKQPLCLRSLLTPVQLRSSSVTYSVFVESILTKRLGPFL